MSGRRIASGGGKNDSTRRPRTSRSSSHLSSSTDDDGRINDFGVPKRHRDKSQTSGDTGKNEERDKVFSSSNTGTSDSETKPRPGRQPRSVTSNASGSKTHTDATHGGKSVPEDRKVTSAKERSADAGTTKIGKPAGSFRRRLSGKPKYGIDEPLTDSDKDPGSSRSIRSASSDGRVTKSAPGSFVDARNLENDNFVEQTLKQTASPLGVAARPKVIDFDVRLKERKRIGRRKVAFKSLIALAVLAVLAAVVWLLFFSPVFLLDPDQIEVSGENNWVGKVQVVSIADKQAGKSLLMVSSGYVEDELKKIPGVSMAKVEKVYPKAMKISITAQEPAAMLKTPDGGETAVDGYGRVLNKVGNVSTKGIPVIEVDNVEVSLRDRSVQQALKVLNLLSHDMRVAVTKVSAKTQDSVTTEINGGQRVIVWGDASDMKLKQAVVDKIINDPTKIGDKHQVDVSAPLRPIIK
ncbi:FtsQ-type POTRA domain-containing protein [Bifidobacterium sp. ESL0745]|uniref:cell division protein FtsQ/DivIB n=1 Tax=Bifidobacterium sp. ESL0745 TaxID=2983226 RepID=UPI0023F66577|nr:FtsQ-type POTRA domain-containing protein [Bifidobacterium sp. ESL0745]MDF7664690.1 FtsQ-type POTRA domain-containing protein [Bifidobacterium sp. ESL0745]